MKKHRFAGTVIFWLSSLGIAITYFFLPLYLRIVNLLFGRTEKLYLNLPDSELPTVSILVPAYNEGKVIKDRIENLLAVDYPREKRQIVVASDMSDDETDEIVKEFESQGVELHRMTERSGKLGIIDRVVPTLTGEIVVITDANVTVEADSLRALIKRYSKKEVGAVSAYMKRIPPKNKKNIDGEKHYIGFEKSIKVGLSILGMVIGAFGGYYSFRKELFRPIGSRPVPDDMVIPMEVLAQGYRVVFAEDAVGIEETLPEIRLEFKRRIRMTAYNFNSVWRILKLSRQAGTVPFIMTIGYKVLRWFSPFLFLLSFLSAVILIPLKPKRFIPIVLMYLVGGILALTGARAEEEGKTVKIANSAYHFSAMNVASILGFFKAIKGIERYWTPRVDD